MSLVRWKLGAVRFIAYAALLLHALACFVCARWATWELLASWWSSAFSRHENRSFNSCKRSIETQSISSRVVPCSNVPSSFSLWKTTSCSGPSALKLFRVYVVFSISVFCVPQVFKERTHFSKHKDEMLQGQVMPRNLKAHLSESAIGRSIYMQ